MSQRTVGTLTAAALALSMHALVGAQSPHGGAGTTLQPGPNVNAAAGIVDLRDPAALIKADLNLQRQNETVAAASVRNPDHILAAANDYRFVDFPDDPGYGGGQSFIARLIARVFRRPPARPVQRAAAAGAWTGVYRSCDRGRTWIGSAVPGGPLDESEAAQQSPLKALSNAAAAAGAHAETTDPVLVAGPDGRMHLVVLGFVRFPNGAVGESRLFYVSYTDRNNREGGTCFHYDFTRQIDAGANHATSNAPSPFVDKPSLAVDADGTLYTAYTVFLDSVRSRVTIARSLDGGITWSRTTPLLNAGFLRNHGTSIAVDPLNGNVYVAWRLFYDNWPLMVISRSFDRGRTFLPATPISHWWPARGLSQIIDQLRQARLQPFDQFSNAPDAPTTARSLAFPSITAGVVNNRTVLYAAWAERANVTLGSPAFGQPDGNGSPRIMFSMSTNGGLTWTPRRAIDAGPRSEELQQRGAGEVTTRASGPQLQPVLSMSGTANPQLLLLYYESRGELAEPFASNFVSGIDRQLDVRTVRINPATGQLVAPSVQVSQYKIQVNSSPVLLAETTPGYAAVSRQNLPMYAGGSAAFFGDYPVLAPSRPFEWSGQRWRWTIEPSSALAMWTDNRDVEFPRDAAGVPSINGDWTTYTPLVPTGGRPLPPNCGHVASRNANPYFAEIGGVIAGAAQTFKPLTIQRSFATYVENRTPQDRYFRMQIQDNEAAGLDASFKQFDFGSANDLLDIRVFGHSGVHRSVWVQPFPANPTASVSILVREISGPGGTVVPNGLSSRIVLNPDPNNNPLISVPPTIPGYDGVTADDSELHNPQIDTPQISTKRIDAPQRSNPQIDTPQIDTPQIDTPQIDTPGVTSSQIAAPQIDTPQIDTIPPGELNGTDVTYTVRNAGTTTSTYEALFDVPNALELIGSGNYQFQVIVTRTTLVPGHQPGPNGGCEPVARKESQVVANIPVPQIDTPQIDTIHNPQIDTPQIDTPQIATFSIAPYNGYQDRAVAAVAADDVSGDLRSATLPDQVQVTLRAIRLKPLSAGGPLYQPGALKALVKAASTNVILGTVEPDGSQPTTQDDDDDEPDLLIEGYTVSVPTLTVAPGGALAVSSWTLRNQSAISTGPVVMSLGYYLSTDSIVTADDTLLLPSSITGTVAGGGTVSFPSQNLTIPAGTAPGAYYVGIVLDTNGVVDESNETNNFVSEPIVVTSTPLACAPTPPDLLSWWPGANNGVDLGDVRHAILNSVSFAPGKVGSAFSFNGDDDVITLPVDEDLRPAQLSVEFWFRSDIALNGDAGIRPLLVMLNAGESYTTTSRGYDVVYAGGQLRFGLNSNGGRVLASYTSTFAPATWHHVAATFDGTLQRLYVDGALRATVDWSTLGGAVFEYAADSSSILVGQILTGAGPAFDTSSLAGRMDEIAIFDRALTASEIQAIVNADLFGKCQPEVGSLLLVTNTNDSGVGSLRQAILDSNATAGVREDIRFLLVGAGPHTIAPLTALPTITDPVGIDGYSQTGADSAPVVEIDGNGLAAAGLSISAGDSYVAGLVINRFGLSGIRVFGAGGNDIMGNYIGTDVSGLVARPNGAHGVLVSSAGNNIGGAHVRGRNVISGNTGSGVVLETSNNQVQGNYIGIGVSGTLPLPNLGIQSGVFIQGGSNNLIGGTAAGEGNVISGNAAHAVTVVGTGAAANRIQGNFIGTDPTGQAMLSNGGIGVDIVEAANTLVGGPGLARNIISGNGLGIQIRSGATGNTVQNNYIGLNAAGTLPIPNNTGISIADLATGNTIGGTTAGTGNVISASAFDGVSINTGASGNTVAGNFIGTTADGAAIQPNGANGINVDGPNNLIGGTVPAARNLISGNNGQGILILGAGATGNAIRGNFIGTNAAGTAALPNGFSGINLAGAPGNTVGGGGIAARNLISGNAGSGVSVSGGVDAGGNVIAGNYIGVNVTGTAAISNGGGGIFLSAPAIIGTTDPDGGNVISGNVVDGIAIAGDDNGSTIQGNRIGTNAAGTAAIGNTASGISISDAEFSVIGGTSTAARNIISGNGLNGISLTNDASVTTIQGNYIGVNAAGTAALPNGASGISVISTPSPLIGGATAAARNIISGNGLHGIFFNDSRNGTVSGNYIGTDVTGNVDLGNANNGVMLFATSDTNTIGGDGGPGTVPGNLISGNDAYGVFVDGSSNVSVKGNRIGTNESGTGALGNGVVVAGVRSHAGVRVENTPGNTVANNQVSGNGEGISLAGALSNGNMVIGNLVGTNASGTLAVPNRIGIINTDAPGTQIGGITVADRNVVSGNTLTGIVVTGAGAASIGIMGNYIGLSAAGTADVGNGGFGVSIEGGATALIGGSRLLNATNLISGNDLAGVQLLTTGSLVWGNDIGPGAGGILTVGNTEAGIRIDGSNNLIGWFEDDDFANTVAGNGQAGIAVVSGTANTIGENAVHQNGGLGIDLGNTGVTANDTGDLDAGANSLLNFPVLTSVERLSPTTTRFIGTFNSTPLTSFTLRFQGSAACDASGHGEGQFLLAGTDSATITVNTDTDGNAFFNEVLAVTTTIGQVVSGVTIDGAGNTSEFSLCRIVTSGS